MKEICNGKINSNGICEKCYKVSQTTSGYCSRLIEVYPLPAMTEQEILTAAEKEEINAGYRSLDPLFEGLEKPQTAEEVLEEYCGHITIPFDENVTVYYPALIKAMKRYATQKHIPTDCYPKEFVEWWFTKGIMEFAIEAFSTPTLFIKFNEGSRRKYTLDELYQYWKEQIK